jgi:hypothetical protein
VLRTIHDRRYLGVDALNLITDALNLVTDTLNLITDTLNLVTDIGHSIVDAKHDIHDSPHSTSIIHSMRGLQDLSSSHLNLLLRQTV